MKKNVLLIILTFVFGIAISQTSETVTTGASYTDEVYYHFDDGSVKTVARDSWDIAFTTEVFDVSILCNNGNQVELYTYSNGDINDWASVDTTGMVWKPMYNSLDSWAYGAFLANINGGEVDYGWGEYNMGTHNVTGDSLFIIKLASGTYKKLAIIEKQSSENTWDFKFADIDGSNEVNVNFDADDYPNTNFTRYSIENETFVDAAVQEADKTAWQLLFTKYYDYTIPYYVSGVVSNFDVYVQEVKETGLDQTTYYDYNLGELSDVITTIGSDWKAYSGGWQIADTVVYFVQDQSAGSDQAIWKLYFTDFGGSSTGEYFFTQEKLAVSTDDINSAQMTVFPNPARDYTNIIYDINGECDLSIYDMTGKQVLSQKINHNDNLNKHYLDLSNLNSGIYTIRLQNDEESATVKFIKQ